MVRQRTVQRRVTIADWACRRWHRLRHIGGPLVTTLLWVSGHMSQPSIAAGLKKGDSEHAIIHAHNATAGLVLLQGQDKAAACVSHNKMLQFVAKLHEGVEDTLSELIAATDRTLEQSSIEITTIEELRLAEAHALEQMHRCQLRAIEAQHDLTTYTRELAELAEIARADTKVYNWNSISLLGMRSVTTSPSSSEHGLASSAKNAGEGASLLQFGKTNLEYKVSTKVRRAAEMHLQAVKAAKKVASCSERLANAAQEGKQGPGDSQEDCNRVRERLQDAYSQAYVHVQSLIEIAQEGVDHETCTAAEEDLLEEKRLELRTKIDRARSQLCNAEQSGQRAEEAATLLRVKLNTTNQVVVPQCGETVETWKAYQRSVGVLLEMAATRIRCEQCCAQASTSIT